jgi:hypothetical protein
MGFNNFNETDILMNIRDGVYCHNKPYQQEQSKIEEEKQKTKNQPKQKEVNLRFDSNQMLLIFDSSTHYLVKRQKYIPEITMIATFLFGMQWLNTFNEYYLGFLGAASSMCWISLISRRFVSNKTICQIHLI